jgi:glycosyltransferase involved in cell wall biosynthesis
MRTPPVGYGGIERVVHTFVEELVREGHEVVLFATPGSYCSGTTVEVAGYDPARAPSGIRKQSDRLSEEPLYQAMREYLQTNPVDMVHDWSFQNLFVMRHPEMFPFVISTCIPPPPDYVRSNLVACSQAHADLCGGSTRYVHYGLHLADYECCFSKKEHFIHIAKIARYKGQHLAMLACRRLGRSLHLAGNIEERPYYHLVVKPLLLVSPRISYLGEIHGPNRYLKDAACLIQTPRWFDAFPYVILESFASGTPVVALSEGGIREQISDGINGILCNSPKDLSEALDRVRSIRPQDCREYAEVYFTVKRMVADYLELYREARDGEHW